MATMKTQQKTKARNSASKGKRTCCSSKKSNGSSASAKSAKATAAKNGK